jgi:hypothetical protein
MLNDYGLQMMVFESTENLLCGSRGAQLTRKICTWYVGVGLRVPPLRSSGIIVHEPDEQESLLHEICALDSDST